jgi:hypothetical protein
MKPLEKIITITRKKDGSVRVHVGEVEIIVFEYHEELTARAHHVTLVIPGGIVNFKGSEE